LAIYQPYDIQEPYYDSFKLASLTVAYDFPGVQLTSNTSYWQRFVIQSQDSTEPLENIFNLTTFIPTLYEEQDPTTQISQEIRLTSTGDGPFQWVGGVYAADLHSGYIGHEQSPAYGAAIGCTAGVSGGSCPPADTFNINNGGQAANPLGILYNQNNPNVMKQEAIFGEASYRLASDLKLTTGLRYYRFTVGNHTDACGVGTGTGNGSCIFGSASGSGSNLLPKVNLSYTPTPDLTVYGTASKGSRPGGVNLPIPLPTAAQLAANPFAYNCGPGSGPVFDTAQPSYYRPDSVWSY
jgi:outer membrane receptor protein involved in Fe transport